MKHFVICLLLEAAAVSVDASVMALRHSDGTRSAEVSVAGRTVAMPDGSASVRGHAETPDGKFVLFVHGLARYHLPATHLDRGWVNSAALSVYDAVTGQRINTVSLDDPMCGAANPWGIAVNDRWIAVSHAGTHEISIMPRERFFSALAARKDDASGDLGFMRSIGRRRIPLKGRGPRSIVFRDDGKLAVTLYFAETIAIVDPETGTVNEPDLVDGLSPAVASDPVRRGEAAFNDATCCYQQWQSCASCHPDGKTDGLRWDFPFSGGGLGHPEETPDLTKLKFYRPRPNDYHISLFEATADLLRDTEAYVRSLCRRRKDPK